MVVDQRNFASSNGSVNFIPTYYEILGLPESLQHYSVIPVHTLRGARRRAMLRNHPDKAKNTTFKKEYTIYSIDQISEAFSTLLNPTTRAKYDKELKLKKRTIDGRASEGEVFRTGVEIVDLDDLEEDESEGTWFRACRCGDSRGFSISEADLEEAVDEGELNVGCRGCSLWLKVLFSVAEDSEDNRARTNAT